MKVKLVGVGCRDNEFSDLSGFIGRYIKRLNNMPINEFFYNEENIKMFNKMIFDSERLINSGDSAAQKTMERLLSNLILLKTMISSNIKVYKEELLEKGEWNDDAINVQTTVETFQERIHQLSLTMGVVYTRLSSASFSGSKKPDIQIKEKEVITDLPDDQQTNKQLSTCSEVSTSFAETKLNKIVKYTVPAVAHNGEEEFPCTIETADTAINDKADIICQCIETLNGLPQLSHDYLPMKNPFKLTLAPQCNSETMSAPWKITVSVQTKRDNSKELVFLQYVPSLVVKDEVPFAPSISLDEEDNTSLFRQQPEVRDSKWEELSSLEIRGGEYGPSVSRYLQTETRVSLPVYLLVVSKIRTERFLIDKKGNYYNSAADNRIIVNAPPNAIKIRVEFRMKIFQFDPQFIFEVKKRLPREFKDLISVSPIIDFTTSVYKKTLKPIQISVPLPAHMEKVSDNIGKPSAISKILQQQESMESYDDKENEYTERRGGYVPLLPFQRLFLQQAFLKDSGCDEIFLLIFDKSSHTWHIWADAHFDKESKTSILIDFNDTDSYKFVAFRTTHRVTSDDVIKMMSMLLNQLSIRSVAFVLRFRPSLDDQPCCLTITSPWNAQAVSEQLCNEQYEESVPISKTLSIQERETIYISMRGNLKNTASNEQFITFQFNSMWKNKLNFNVNILDKHAQKNVDTYRGFVQIFISQTVKRRVNNKIVWVTEKVLLCELRITKPKPPVPVNVSFHTSDFTFSNKHGLSTTILRRISNYIHYDWRTLSCNLGMSKTRAENIMRMKAGCDESIMAFEMLLSWVKGTKRSTDRVSILANALVASGRPDIAHDLRHICLSS